jgi:hypothetical protein
MPYLILHCLTIIVVFMCNVEKPVGSTFYLLLKTIIIVIVRYTLKYLIKRNEDQRNLYKEKQNTFLRDFYNF